MKKFWAWLKSLFFKKKQLDQPVLVIATPSQPKIIYIENKTQILSNVGTVCLTEEEATAEIEAHLKH